MTEIYNISTNLPSNDAVHIKKKYFQLNYTLQLITHRHRPLFDQTLTMANETRRLVWSSTHSMRRRRNIDD